MSNSIIALIRTWVPIVVGTFAAWLITLGVELTPSTELGLVTGLTGLLIGLYWAAVTLLTKWKPAFGILLGVKGVTAPTYDPPN